MNTSILSSVHRHSGHAGYRMLFFLSLLLSICNLVVALPISYRLAPAQQPAMTPQRPALPQQAVGAPQRPVAPYMNQGFGAAGGNGFGLNSAMRPLANTAAGGFGRGLPSAGDIANRVIGNRLPSMPGGSTTIINGNINAIPQAMGGTSAAAKNMQVAIAATGGNLNVAPQAMGGTAAAAKNMQAAIAATGGHPPLGAIGKPSPLVNPAAGKPALNPLLAGGSSSSRGLLPGMLPAASASSLGNGLGSNGQTYAQIAAIAGKPVPGTPGATPAFAGQNPAMKQMPSFNTMYQRLNPVLGHDELILFTGNTRAAAQRLQDQGHGTLITDLLKRGGIDETVVNRIPGTTADNGNEFFARAGAALGQAAKGNIKVTMPTDFRADGSSFFEQWELPFLKSNPNVNQVMGLMYRNDGAGGWVPAGQRLLYSNPGPH